MSDREQIAGKNCGARSDVSVKLGSELRESKGGCDVISVVIVICDVVIVA